ncbi:uncharacterized protein SCHCODRAFT_02661351 [Schizophyllum commune H4-8]|nr:uncharacterized protein SCHCODRAFT_02661351 [Schizophyllum commune H4-8]KAI5899759.1 hypothetical protein SCHCODRAFT_02661351 [Schizophyllum commune H4-8]
MCELILQVWSLQAQMRRGQPDAHVPDLFVLVHGMLFTNIQKNDFQPSLARLLERLTINGAEERAEFWCLLARKVWERSYGKSGKDRRPELEILDAHEAKAVLEDGRVEDKEEAANHQMVDGQLWTHFFRGVVELSEQTRGLMWTDDESKSEQVKELKAHRKRLESILSVHHHTRVPHQISYNPFDASHRAAEVSNLADVLNPSTRIANVSYLTTGAFSSNPTPHNASLTSMASSTTSSALPPAYHARNSPSATRFSIVTPAESASVAGALRGSLKAGKKLLEEEKQRAEDERRRHNIVDVQRSHATWRCAEARAEMERLQRELERSQQEMECMKNSRNAHDNAEVLEDAKEEAERAQKEAEEALAEVKRLDAELERAREASAKTSDAKDGKHGDKDGKETKKLEAARKELTKMKKELKQVKKEHEQARKDGEGKGASKLKKLEGELKPSKDTRDRALRDLETTRNDLDTARKDLDATCKELTTTRKDLEIAQGEAEGAHLLASQAVGNAHNVVKMQEEVWGLQEQLAKLKKERSQAKNTQEELESRVREREESIKERDEMIKEHKEMTKELEGKLRDAETQAAEVKASAERAAQKEKQLARTRTEADKLQRANERGRMGMGALTK